MKPLSVGLLDFGYRSAHLNSMVKLSDIVEYAVLGEALGFDKFWLGEHHMPRTTLPYNDPTLLIPVLAGYTKTIHLGTAGTLISIHQPYQVASAFKLYSNVYRNRIDLGFANGQPYEGVAQYAGGQSSAELIAQFEDKVKQTVFLLRQEEAVFRQSGVVLPPFKGAQPRLWTLGSSAHSIRRALELGTHLCFWADGQLSPDLRDRLQEYQERFRAQYGTTPEIRVVVLGICHPSERKARTLARMQEEKETLLWGNAARFEEYICRYADYYNLHQFMFFNSVLNPAERIPGVEVLSEQLMLGPAAVV